MTAVASILDSASLEPFSPKDLQSAGKLRLKNGPKSPDAHLFVQGLMDAVVVPAWPAGKQPRPSSLEASRLALGALLADLLELEGKGLVGSCGASPKDFTTAPAGRDIFKRVMDALAAAGLLHVQSGSRGNLTRFPNRQPGFEGQYGPTTAQGGEVSRYRLSADALGRAGAAGVHGPAAAWADHWGRDVAAKHGKAVRPSKAPLLTLRARKVRVNGVPEVGQNLLVDAGHPKVVEFLQDLEEHNVFMMAADVGGINFRGVGRTFNDGDQPGFAWQWGGGFYALKGGEAGESPKRGDRLQVITIGGEQVGEVDISASFLSLLYGLRGAPFDARTADPYAVGGLDRAIVKAWTTKALGIGKADYRRWSTDALENYAAVAPGRTLRRDFPIATVAAAVLQAHPVLQVLGQPGFTALDLQFHQSEVMRGAMARLRHDGIASLSVHDSLVVQVGALGVAARAIGDAFSCHIETVTGAPCRVRLSVKAKT